MEGKMVLGKKGRTGHFWNVFTKFGEVIVRYSTYMSSHNVEEDIHLLSNCFQVSVKEQESYSCLYTDLYWRRQKIEMKLAIFSWMTQGKNLSWYSGISPSFLQGNKLQIYRKMFPQIKGNNTYELNLQSKFVSVSAAYTAITGMLMEKTYWWYHYMLLKDVE